jgi:hypothetical protein
MAQSADLARTYEIGVINTLPVYGTTTLYRGVAAGEVSGYIRALVAGDPFRGFVDAYVTNVVNALTGDTGASGAKSVNLITDGLLRITLTGVAITDVGKPVYMSDDETFTLTQGTNSLVGYVYRYVAANTCVITFGGKAETQASAVDTTAVTPVIVTNTTETVASVNAIITKLASVVAALNTLIGENKG